MPEESPKLPANFFALTPAELVETMTTAGLPKFRAQQLLDWVYKKYETDITKMSNFSARDRETLAKLFDFSPGEIVKQQTSEDGTHKILVAWKRTGWDGPATTETVMIPDDKRRSICVSSQVGCPVGCKFCASGLNGLKGSLDAGEIVYQFFLINRELAKHGERPTNLVFMGMGEPLANFANVIKAIEILHDPNCFDLGARRITVSTVGVPQRIRDLADVDLPLNLALSLHAPNEPLRRQLIPWADHFALDDILDACRDYFDKTGREITLEYILLSHVNDQPEHARELAKLCKTMRANVNLIRYNEVEALPFIRPKSDDVIEFQKILRDAGINAHVRKSRGRDIDAACGQLRRKTESSLVTIGKSA